MPGATQRTVYLTDREVAVIDHFKRRWNRPSRNNALSEIIRQIAQQDEEAKRILENKSAKAST
jgi:hypothetical protein